MTINEYYSAIEKLNTWTKLYDEATPAVSDKEWDDLYFLIQAYEEDHPEDISENSPTQKIIYQVVDKLNKVEHNHPMLSLDKTKELKVIDSFVKGHDWIIMAKMDGLTCSLRYLNGRLVSAETRGDGLIGEDVTHNAMVIPSIPKIIDYKDELVIDGEIICTYKDFESFSKEYKYV